jgi:hypothetical protein
VEAPFIDLDELSIFWDGQGNILFVVDNANLFNVHDDVLAAVLFFLAVSQKFVQ